MDNVAQDLRYAIRSLSKARGFTAIALLTLALAIGASTAIFTLVDSLLLRPLPIRDPGRLVALRLLTLDGQQTHISYNTFKELAARQQVFSGIFAWDANDLNDFQVGNITWHGPRMTVTGNFYNTVGALPFMGRGIADEDLTSGAPPVAVISYEVWKYRLGGDPAILNKTLKIQNEPFRIIGVTPPRFFGLIVGISMDVTVPFTTVELFTLRGATAPENVIWLDVAGRLKPQVSLKQAAAQLNSVGPTLLADAAAAASEEQRPWLPTHVEVESAATGFSSLRARFSRPLFLLMAMVILVLLLVCTNLSGLMLARSAARRYEMAVCIALGASSRRILLQLLTETLLLAGVGAVAGILLSLWMSRGLANFVWTGLVPLSLNLRPDTRILTFAILSTLLTGLFCGLVPGLRATRQDPILVLHHGGIAGASTGRFGKALVITQIVFSGVLLATAWSVVAHLRLIRAEPLGFDAGRVLTMRLLNRPGAYRDLDHAVYDRELLQQVAAAEGVQSASLSQGALLSGLDSAVPVSRSLDGTGAITALFGVVSPDFFRTLGMQIREGRDFGWHDGAHSPPVAIVSARLGSELFAGESALNRSIRLGAHSFTVVGVVGDARLGNVRDEKPAIYLASFQDPDQILQPLLEVRSVGDPASVADSARNAVESLGREYPLKTATLQRDIDEQLIPERIIAVLSAAFGVLAFALAVISLYGLISYSVSHRTNEIGLRMALGAQKWNVVQVVMRDVFVLVLIGETLAVPVALVVLRVVPHFLSGVRAGLAPLLAAGAALAIAAVMAAFLPTRKATQVDPMIALKFE